jgi:hypothetical protein
MHFNSVDLPAAFGPMTAVTRPDGMWSMLMPRKTDVAP